MDTTLEPTVEDLEKAPIAEADADVDLQAVRDLNAAYEQIVDQVVRGLVVVEIHPAERVSAFFLHLAEYPPAGGLALLDELGSRQPFEGEEQTGKRAPRDRGVVRKRFGGGETGARTY